MNTKKRILDEALTLFSEKGYANVGQQVMEKFAEEISEVGVVEKKPMLEGRNMTMFLAPLS